MTLTEKQIAKLESKGFKRWTKGDYDRLYINAYNIHGIDTNWKKNGKKTLTINGEELSYTKSAELSYAKIYIDVKTGEVVADWDSVKALAEAELNEVIEETTETVDVTTEEKSEVESICKVMTREELITVYGEKTVNRLDESEWKIQEDEIDDGWDGYEPKHKELLLNDKKRTLLCFYEQYSNYKNCYVAFYDA